MYNFLILAFALILISTGQGHASIAFVAEIDGNWDLFTVGEDGKNLVRLTSTPYDEKDPCWSPDRKKIVYSTSDGKLHILEIDSAAIHEVPDSNCAAKEPSRITPSFSPKSNEIAFAQLIPGARDDTDLVIFNLETKKSKRVVSQVGAQFWPSWSPDGLQVVYVSTHCSADCGRIIQELWVADPKGGHARQLLLTNSLCQQPAWSPDGRSIAFSSDRTDSFDIWLLSLENGKTVQITNDESLDCHPVWSADSNKLAFVSTRSGIMEIWIKDLKSGELKPLRPFGKAGIQCKDVAW